MGPTLLFHLGGDEGGLAAFCERFSDSFNRWWDDLGHPHLDDETAQRLADGLSASVGSRSIRELATERDELLATVVAATHGRTPDRVRRDP
jgi:carnitine 3-dehydrogenase